MREILTTAELVTVSAADPMIAWAGQGFRPGVRAWYDGDAVAVAAPDAAIAVYQRLGYTYRRVAAASVRT